MSLLGQLLPPAMRYRAWCWKKYFREPEIRLASRMAIPGSRCLDIGANAGAYSYFMRRAGARVEAFEPIPELASALKERFGDSLSVHQIAASNRNASTTIHAPIINGRPIYGYASCENNWADNEEVALSVETRTIDSFQFDNVSLIKIDVEGYELAVLEGACETIDRHKPAFIIEAEERHRTNAVPSVANFLQKFGYRGKFLVGGIKRPLTDFDQSRDQAKPETAGYICNFVFTANG